MARHRKRKTRRSSSGPRASWRGMVRFGLVAFPVEAFNAHSPEGSPLALHQLHAKCHSRIKYQKTCPIHGPCDNDEIVSGYEYSKGRYVEIDPEELDELGTDSERALTIDAFVASQEIDAIYFDGRMYYLSPDGDAAREPYAVFLEALRKRERWGIGQVVFSGREQLVALRPYDDALHMAMLNYAAEIRNPESTVAPPAAVKGSDRKVKLAEQLIESWSDDKFDFSKYEDTYVAKMKKLIDAKVHGREVVTPEVEEEPEVINLMDALKKSLGKPAPAKEHEKPTPRRKAAHARRRHAS